MSSKEVYFNIYCPKCKYADVYEGDDPCNDCLANGMNDDSHKPIRFKPKEEE